MDDEIKKVDETQPEEENKSAISADLIRGHINTIILRTLYEKDKYGYEIMEEIESKSHGQYSLKQPTLYSALKRLESQGYITAYWKTDEVSNGGRRKYYKLTDSGKEITEKNQSEWEYSRTVIDSLISDRNFDFTQPPPTPVDFKILKSSTSRVPTVKTDDEDKHVEQSIVETTKQEISEIVSESPAPIQEVETKPIIEPTPPVQSVAEQPEPEPIPVYNQAPQQPIYQATPADEERRAAEERRRHENYLRLVSQPIAETEETPTNPNSDNIDTDKLIYNRKPETERDYKNLIDNLFVRTVRQQVKPEPKAAIHEEIAATQYHDAAVKANEDGLKVNSSDNVVTTGRKKKYIRGLALLKSALIVAVVCLVEFALSLAFKDALCVEIGYPIVILTLGIAQLLIFGILTTTDFGKSTRKPTNQSYLTASVVLAIIAIMIIFVVSLLLNVNFANAGDVVAKIILPSLVALNIPLFSTIFYVLSK